MADDALILRPSAGLSPGIGFYLAGMDEVRSQLRDAVVNMSPEDIGRCAIPGAHSIGALVLHIGEAEWWWMNCNVLGHRLTDADRAAPYWDVLKNPEAFAARGCSAEFCLEQVGRIRNQTREILAGFADDELERVFATERRGRKFEHSLRWILHHLIDHEAQHKGQVLMLKRLLGIENKGPFN